MNIQKKLAAMTFVALVSAFAASAADLTGTWNAEFETPMGKMNSTYVLKQSGDKVTGKVLGEFGGEKRESELKDIKLQGTTLSFVESLDMQGNTLNIEYKGTVAGDEIKFSRKIGDFGNDEIVAKRAKDVAAPAPAAKK
jgi:opacity protein-like surface antigen